MTTANDNVMTGLEIAKLVSKGKDAYDADTKKAARGFLKRKRDQRERVLPKLLAAVAVALGTPDETSPEAILKAVTGAPTKKAAKKAVPKTRRSKKVEAKPPTDRQIKKALAPNKPAPEKKETEPETTEPTPQPTAHVSVKAIADTLQQAEGKHLGDLCGWSISGTRPKDRVDNLAVLYGLEEDFHFPKLTPNSCYRKAIQQTFNLGKKDHGKAMAVLVEDSANKIVHSIVTSSVVDDDDDAVSTKDAEFKTEIKVGFNKEAYRDGASAGACLVLEDETHPSAVALRAKYTELAETYLSYDIRNAFQHAFRLWDACPILPHGGLWYIPSIHAEKVRAWHGFMTDLGMTTAVIPAFDTKETLESLRQSTRNGLEGQLSDMMYLLDMYAREGWDTVRTKTLEKRVEEFDELRARAELYSSILGTTVNDLTEKVKRAGNRLTKDITKRQEDEAAEAEEKAKEKAEAKAAKKAEREAAKKEKAAAKKKVKETKPTPEAATAASA